jgi:glutamate N-acetyltransferase/amino-acid N-acetyltransferase
MKINIGAENALTFPGGFKAAGVACGIKDDSRDIMLLLADRICASAGVFTKNHVKAAPVIYSQNIVKSGQAQAVVINSGVANACTGDEGMQKCVEMAQATAENTGIPAEMVLVCSTGVIGRQLPMDKIKNGIAHASHSLSVTGGHAAALAIMTTDTHPKEISVTVVTNEGEIKIGGVAKGSGMIAPNMATMLSVITTDAQIDPEILQNILSRVVDRTYNCVTVDGDTSTNDTVLMLASGVTNIRMEQGTEELALFEDGLLKLASELAKMIARDGEGATKLVEITVAGATDSKSAAVIARTIANSPLVKTAIFGNDPNWGRVLAAAGRAGILFDQYRVDLDFAGIPVVRNGQPVAFDKPAAIQTMKSKEVKILLTLGEGAFEATVWTCDFSYDYVRINADYTT